MKCSWKEPILKCTMHGRTLEIRKILCFHGALQYWDLGLAEVETDFNRHSPIKKKLYCYTNAKKNLLFSEFLYAEDMYTSIGKSCQLMYLNGLFLCSS